MGQFEKRVRKYFQVISLVYWAAIVLFAIAAWKSLVGICVILGIGALIYACSLVAYYAAIEWAQEEDKGT